MRLQGKITDWRADRGFGFITPNGGGKTIFLHVSALRRGAGKPRQDDIVTYMVMDGPKGPKADDVAIVRLERNRGAANRSRWRTLAESVTIVIIVGWLGIMGFNKYNRARLAAMPPDVAHTPAQANVPAMGDTPTPSKLLGVTPTSSRFKCDGRTHCSQMSSCEEAKFFINNCPGTTMDGDNDGIPCEQGVCR